MLQYDRRGIDERLRQVEQPKKAGLWNGYYTLGLIVFVFVILYLL